MYGCSTTLKELLLLTPERCITHIQLFLDKSEVDFDHPHFRERLMGRDITMHQALATLLQGDMIDGPKRDVHGDYRMKFKHYVVGRKIQVVVAMNKNKCTAITVIWGEVQ